MYQSLSVWLCLVITVIIALLPDYVLRTVRDHRDSLQEIRLDKMKSLSNVSSWTVSKETESFTVPRYSESSTSTDPPRREGPSSMPYNSRFMTNGRISLVGADTLSLRLYIVGGVSYAVISWMVNFMPIDPIYFVSPFIFDIFMFFFLCNKQRCSGLDLNKVYGTNENCSISFGVGFHLIIIPALFRLISGRTWLDL